MTPSHPQQSVPIFHEFFGGLEYQSQLLSGSGRPPTEKEFLKWSKAEDWCEWQRGVDELKEKEEEQLLG